MATKTIETKAIISAQDKTGATFAQVAQKLKGLENTAAAASRRMDHLARGMSSVGEKRMLHDSIAARMAGIGPVAAAGVGYGARAAAFGAAAHQRAVDTAVVAGATAVFAAPIVKRIIDQSAARQTEGLRMQFAGMTPAEIAKTNTEAQRLGREYKPIGQTTIGKMIKDARTIAGDTEGALTFIEPLLKFRVQLQSINKGASEEQISEELEKILRAADLMGATKNLGKFTTFLEGVGRAVNVFGDSVPPSAIFSAAQHAGAASTQYSKEFVAGVFPSLIQTMGGDTAGTALGSLFTALVGGRMKVKSAKLLNELGLIDPTKLVKNKQGDVAGLMPGGLMGGSLALTDPFRYATEVVLPALTRKGITDPQKITETLAGAFSDKNVAKLMTHMILNREQIGRDVAMAKGGMDLTPTAKKLMTEDLPTATKGLTEQFNNLAAALGKGVTPAVTSWTNSIADKLGEFSKKAENDPKTNMRAWLAGGIAAPVLSHLGLSALGSYFGGAGVAAGFGTMAGATLPILAGGTILGGGYAAGSAIKDAWGRIPDTNQLPPQNMIERFADRFDRATGITSYDSYSTVAARMKSGWTAQFQDAPRAGQLGFGFGAAGVGEKAGAMLDPNNIMGGLMAAIKGAPAQPVRLEGAAEIKNMIEVMPSPDFLVRVEQATTARGALRSDVGVSMPQ